MTGIKTFSALAFLLLLALLTTCSMAQNKSSKPLQHGAGFVDKNGDGYNDNAPDQDGDGIPNGLDPDYKAPGKMHQGHGGMRGFIDANGDGINDRTVDANGVPYCKNSNFVPPQNGTGRKTGLGRGMGYGLRTSGQGSGPQSGVCDGTGPKGMRRGR
ncbi:MAG: hypothetical protein HF314_16165 [Ignavibacteria bacterium]|nr:hypothetical protein [Ignavibacteria bacterium]MCU7504617.1 hypothetical protein [Ignavibacteria bacterium]MCU7517967.1 hypothetical protein [Ignavibacteria bacterium]